MPIQSQVLLGFPPNTFFFYTGPFTPGVGDFQQRKRYHFASLSDDILAAAFRANYECVALEQHLVDIGSNPFQVARIAKLRCDFFEHVIEWFHGPQNCPLKCIKSRKEPSTCYRCPQG